MMQYLQQLKSDKLYDFGGAKEKMYKLDSATWVAKMSQCNKKYQKL